MAALGFKARVDFLTSTLFLRFTSGVTPAVYGSQAFLIHIPVEVSVSIDGGLGIEPMTIYAICNKHDTVNHLATPAGLEKFSIFLWCSSQVNANGLGGQNDVRIQHSNVTIVKILFVIDCQGQLSIHCSLMEHGIK